MKRLLLFVLFVVLTVPVLAQEKGQEPAPSQEPVAVPTEPVKLNPETQEVVRDMLRILREIRRVEAADGIVQIPESINLLRAQFNAKNERLNKWVKEKGIPADWKLNDNALQFEPPAKSDDKKPQ